MQAIVKIYQNQSATTPIAQFGDILELEISEDINGISFCNVSIPADTANISQYKKIEVYEITNSGDEVLFTGYIDSFIPSVRDIKLTCKSEKGLLARKIVTTDRSFASKTITEILTTLFADWSGLYSENWTVSTSITTTVNKDVKIGDNFYDIIEELAGMVDAVWNSSGMTVTVGTLLGTDYTGADNFKELVYNGDNPRENNIDNVQYESYGTISNVVIGNDGTSKSRKEDATSISTYGPLGESKNFRPGDLANSTQKYLDSKKGGQFVYKIAPTQDGRFDAKCGDKVAMRIENVSSYFNYTGDVIINTKKTRIVNASKICEYTVSDKYVYFDSFVNRFLAVESDLNLNIVR